MELKRGVQGNQSWSSHPKHDVKIQPMLGRSPPCEPGYSLSQWIEEKQKKQDYAEDSQFDAQHSTRT
jgi:hypothetical protein